MNRSQEIIKNHSAFKQICRYYGAIRQETHYDVLGISRNASKQDIRSAYLKLSKEKHPDKSVQEHKGSHDDFVKINEAYSVLSKNDLKLKYDHKLKYGNGYGNSFRVYTSRSSAYNPEDFHPYDTYHNMTMKSNMNNYGFRHAHRFQHVFSKTQAVILCVMIWMFGNMLHIWAIMKSPTFNRQSLLDRSQKFSIEEGKARTRAHENELIYDNNAEIALAILDQMDYDD